MQRQCYERQYCQDAKSTNQWTATDTVTVRSKTDGQNHGHNIAYCICPPMEKCRLSGTPAARGRLWMLLAIISTMRFCKKAVDNVWNTGSNNVLTNAKCDQANQMP
mmetsp:Transcript_106402/g.189195  ORF Transcript_106402/g.189195 Transcript_106402/m.189195 type:complete len:106 (+) Transcript_106402:696-1013(+)